MTKNFPRLYVLSSSKLNKGKACAQSCHAVAEFQAKHPSEFEAWDNYYLVCLRGDLESRKNAFLAKAVLESQKEKPDYFALPKIAEYKEPDMDDQVTAMAFLALNEKQLAICEELFKDLPLV